MTGTAMALSLSESITQRLGAFFEKQMRPDEIPEFDIRGIRRDIERLAAINRIEADTAECDLETLLFNYERCVEVISNIRANGQIAYAQIGSFRVASNFLYATEALGLIRGVFENPMTEEYHKIIGSAAAVGAFNEIALGIELANKRGLVFKVTKLVQMARQAQEVLTSLGISDAQVASCIDAAGEILRDKKLLWFGSGPDVYVVPASSGGGAVSIEFKIPVSAKEASAMSWSLTEKIVERDLDFPGLSIGFLGLTEPARAAA